MFGALIGKGIGMAAGTALAGSIITTSGEVMAGGSNISQYGGYWLAWCCRCVYSEQSVASSQ